MYNQWEPSFPFQHLSLSILSQGFSSMFKYLIFDLKSRSSTRNCGESTSWRDPWPLPGHNRYQHPRTSQAMQQKNWWVTWERQVRPDQIQVDWLLPRIGGFCIHFFIQSRIHDCDSQRSKPNTHRIKECHLILSINNTSHGGLTLLKYVNRKLRSRFGATSRRRLWRINENHCQSRNHLSIAHQVQGDNLVDQELTDNW